MGTPLVLSAAPPTPVRWRSAGAMGARGCLWTFCFSILPSSSRESIRLARTFSLGTPPHPPQESLRDERGNLCLKRILATGSAQQVSPLTGWPGCRGRTDGPRAWQKGVKKLEHTSVTVSEHKTLSYL